MESPLLKDLPAPLRKLDAAILHYGIFGKLLGMTEAEQKDLQYMNFIKEERQALELVEEKEACGLFLMQAPKMRQIQEIAQAGLIMPPKTTYFYPKLLSGLVFNRIDCDGVVEPI